MRRAELRADGRHRAVVRIEYHLTVAEMTQAVALNLYDVDPPRRITYGAIRTAAATELRYRGGEATMTFVDRVEFDRRNRDYRLLRAYNELLPKVAAAFGYPAPRLDDYEPVEHDETDEDEE